MNVNLLVGVIKRLLSVPILWDSVQAVFGAMRFERELYLSKLHPPGKLLDFGCANGHIADAFAGFDYYGVDIDPVAIDRTCISSLQTCTLAPSPGRV
jgi:Methyltransferase domain